ncbi:ROK family protein [Ectobacillus ponti]|uniref:ROK family protein n=1 Tax=Ectobacillus ponti TaxID=2961894 RepID=A0AA42BQ22_9BACI|nr:ROK family protein [Ectobacillus ponti]MCP8969402.1 ROK family protein [Ectobacillus ponti]
MEKYIAFDIGGTKVKHGLVLADGTIIHKGSYRTDCDSLEIFLADMLRVIEEYGQEEAAGIAISMPGFINVDTGYAEWAGAVAALQGQNLKQLLVERTSLRVEIENDGNCAALAEKLNGNAVECRNFICLTIGTGIGGGIFVNDQIVHGHRFRGGEFGFMFTQASDTNKDSMHDNASTAALIKKYKEYKGIETPVEGADVFAEAYRDEEVKRILDQWYSSLSYGIYNLAATLNPQKILIGGGVSAREEIAAELTTKLEALPYWEMLQVPLQVCKHRNDAGLLGAVCHFQRTSTQDN